MGKKRSLYLLIFILWVIPAGFLSSQFLRALSQQISKEQASIDSDSPSDPFTDESDFELEYGEEDNEDFNFSEIAKEVLPHFENAEAIGIETRDQQDEDEGNDTRGLAGNSQTTRDPNQLPKLTSNYALLEELSELYQSYLRELSANLPKSFEFLRESFRGNPPKGDPLIDWVGPMSEAIRNLKAVESANPQDPKIESLFQAAAKHLKIAASAKHTVCTKYVGEKADGKTGIVKDPNVKSEIVDYMVELCKVVEDYEKLITQGFAVGPLQVFSSTAEEAKATEAAIVADAIKRVGSARNEIINILSPASSCSATVAQVTGFADCKIQSITREKISYKTVRGRGGKRFKKKVVSQETVPPEEIPIKDLSDTQRKCLASIPQACNFDLKGVTNAQNKFAALFNEEYHRKYTAFEKRRPKRKTDRPPDPPQIPQNYLTCKIFADTIKAELNAQAALRKKRAQLLARQRICRNRRAVIQNYLKKAKEDLVARDSSIVSKISSFFFTSRRTGAYYRYRLEPEDLNGRCPSAKHLQFHDAGINAEYDENTDYQAQRVGIGHAPVIPRDLNQLKSMQGQNWISLYRLDENTQKYFQDLGKGDWGKGLELAMSGKDNSDTSKAFRAKIQEEVNKGNGIYLDGAGTSQVYQMQSRMADHLSKAYYDAHTDTIPMGDRTYNLGQEPSGPISETNDFGHEYSKFNYQSLAHYGVKPPQISRNKEDDPNKSITPEESNQYYQEWIQSIQSSLSKDDYGEDSWQVLAHEAERRSSNLTARDPQDASLKKDLKNLTRNGGSFLQTHYLFPGFDKNGQIADADLQPSITEVFGGQSNDPKTLVLADIQLLDTKQRERFFLVRSQLDSGKLSPPKTDADKKRLRQYIFGEKKEYKPTERIKVDTEYAYKTAADSMVANFTAGRSIGYQSNELDSEFYKQPRGLLLAAIQDGGPKWDPVKKKLVYDQSRSEKYIHFLQENNLTSSNAAAFLFHVKNNPELLKNPQTKAIYESLNHERVRHMGAVYNDRFGVISGDLAGTQNGEARLALQRTQDTRPPEQKYDLSQITVNHSQNCEDCYSAQNSQFLGATIPVEGNENPEDVAFKTYYAIAVSNGVQDPEEAKRIARKAVEARKANNIGLNTIVPEGGGAPTLPTEDGQAQVLISRVLDADFFSDVSQSQKRFVKTVRDPDTKGKVEVSAVSKRYEFIREPLPASSLRPGIAAAQLSEKEITTLDDKALVKRFLYRQAGVQENNDPNATLPIYFDPDLGRIVDVQNEPELIPQLAQSIRNRSIDRVVRFDSVIQSEQQRAAEADAAWSRKNYRRQINEALVDTYIGKIVGNGSANLAKSVANTPVFGGIMNPAVGWADFASYISDGGSHILNNGFRRPNAEQIKKMEENRTARLIGITQGALDGATLGGNIPYIFSKILPYAPITIPGLGPLVIGSGTYQNFTKGTNQWLQNNVFDSLAFEFNSQTFSASQDPNRHKELNSIMEFNKMATSVVVSMPAFEGVGGLAGKGLSLFGKVAMKAPKIGRLAQAVGKSELGSFAISQYANGAIMSQIQGNGHFRLDSQSGAIVHQSFDEQTKQWRDTEFIRDILPAMNSSGVTYLMVGALTEKAINPLLTRGVSRTLSSEIVKTAGERVNVFAKALNAIQRNPTARNEFLREASSQFAWQQQAMWENVYNGMNLSEAAWMSIPEFVSESVFASASRHASHSKSTNIINFDQKSVVSNHSLSPVAKITDEHGNVFYRQTYRQTDKNGNTRIITTEPPKAVLDETLAAEASGKRPLIIPIKLSGALKKELDRFDPNSDSYYLKHQDVELAKMQLEEAERDYKFAEQMAENAKKNRVEFEDQIKAALSPSDGSAKRAPPTESVLEAQARLAWSEHLTKLVPDIDKALLDLANSRAQIQSQETAKPGDREKLQEIRDQEQSLRRAKVEIERERKLGQKALEKVVSDAYSNPKETLRELRRAEIEATQALGDSRLAKDEAEQRLGAVLDDGRWGLEAKSDTVPKPNQDEEDELPTTTSTSRAPVAHASNEIPSSRPPDSSNFKIPEVTPENAKLVLETDILDSEKSLEKEAEEIKQEKQKILADSKGGKRKTLTKRAARDLAFIEKREAIWKRNKSELNDAKQRAISELHKQLQAGLDSAHPDFIPANQMSKPENVKKLLEIANRSNTSDSKNSTPKRIPAKGVTTADIALKDGGTSRDNALAKEILDSQSFLDRIFSPTFSKLIISLRGNTSQVQSGETQNSVTGLALSENSIPANKDDSAELSLIVSKEEPQAKPVEVQSGKIDEVSTTVGTAPAESESKVTPADSPENVIAKWNSVTDVPNNLGQSSPSLSQDNVAAINRDFQEQLDLASEVSDNRSLNKEDNPSDLVVELDQPKSPSLPVEQDDSVPDDLKDKPIGPDSSDREARGPPESELLPNEPSSSPPVPPAPPVETKTSFSAANRILGVIGRLLSLGQDSNPNEPTRALGQIDERPADGINQQAEQKEIANEGQADPSLAQTPPSPDLVRTLANLAPPEAEPLTPATSPEFSPEIQNDIATINQYSLDGKILRWVEDVGRGSVAWQIVKIHPDGKVELANSKSKNKINPRTLRKKVDLDKFFSAITVNGLPYKKPKPPKFVDVRVGDPVSVRRSEGKNPNGRIIEILPDGKVAVQVFYGIYDPNQEQGFGKVVVPLSHLEVPNPNFPNVPEISKSENNGDRQQRGPPNIPDAARPISKSKDPENSGVASPNQNTNDTNVNEFTRPIQQQSSNLHNTYISQHIPEVKGKRPGLFTLYLTTIKDKFRNFFFPNNTHNTIEGLSPPDPRPFTVGELVTFHRRDGTPQKGEVLSLKNGNIVVGFNDKNDGRFGYKLISPYQVIDRKIDDPTFKLEKLANIPAGPVSPDTFFPEPVVPNSIANPSRRVERYPFEGSQEEAREILTQSLDYLDDRTAADTFISNLNLQTVVKTGDVKYYISDLFMDEEKRHYSIVVVELPNGKRYRNLYYQSLSTGRFAVLPAYSLYPEHFNKGIRHTKDFVDAPAHLQGALDALVSKKAYNLNYGTVTEPYRFLVPNFYDSESSYNFSHSIYSNVFSRITGNLNKIYSLDSLPSDLADLEKKYKETRNHIPPAFPSKIRIPEFLMPNFKNAPDRTGKLKHDLFDYEIEFEAYQVQSGNMLIEYVFQKDPKTNRVWLASIEDLKSPINELGLKDFQIDGGRAMMPIYQYTNPGMMHEYFMDWNHLHPKRTNYINAWNYVRELEIIQKYFHEKGIALPPKLNGETTLLKDFFPNIGKNPIISFAKPFSDQGNLHIENEVELAPPLKNALAFFYSNDGGIRKALKELLSHIPTINIRDQQRVVLEYVNQNEREISRHLLAAAQALQSQGIPIQYQFEGRAYPRIVIDTDQLQNISPHSQLGKVLKSLTRENGIWSSANGRPLKIEFDPISDLINGREAQFSITPSFIKLNLSLKALINPTRVDSATLHEINHLAELIRLSKAEKEYNLNLLTIAELRKQILAAERLNYPSTKKVKEAELEKLLKRQDLISDQILKYQRRFATIKGNAAQLIDLGFSPHHARAFDGNLSLSEIRKFILESAVEAQKKREYSKKSKSRSKEDFDSNTAQELERLTQKLLDVITLAEQISNRQSTAASEPNKQEAYFLEIPLGNGAIFSFPVPEGHSPLRAINELKISILDARSRAGLPPPESTASLGTRIDDLRRQEKKIQSTLRDQEFTSSNLEYLNQLKSINADIRQGNYQTAQNIVQNIIDSASPRRGIPIFSRDLKGTKENGKLVPTGLLLEGITPDGDWIIRAGSKEVVDFGAVTVGNDLILQKSRQQILLVGDIFTSTNDLRQLDELDPLVAAHSVSAGDIVAFDRSDGSIANGLVAEVSGDFALVEFNDFDRIEPMKAAEGYYAQKWVRLSTLGPARQDTPAPQFFKLKKNLKKPPHPSQAQQLSVDESLLLRTVIPNLEGTNLDSTTQKKEIFNEEIGRTEYSRAPPRDQILAGLENDFVQSETALSGLNSLVFKYTTEIAGTKYYISEFFRDGPRKYCVVVTEVNGKKFVNLFYQSNSTARFTLLPGFKFKTDGRIGHPIKGFLGSKDLIEAPIALQTLLHKQGLEQVSVSETIGNLNSISFIKAIVPGFSPYVGTDIIYDTVQLIRDGTLRKMKKFFKYLSETKPLSASLLNKKPPPPSRYVTYPWDNTIDPSFLPDFESDPVRKGLMNHELFDYPIEFETYVVTKPGNPPMTIEYMFNRDPKTDRVWLAMVENPDSPINSMGIRNNQLDIGNFLMPIYQYTVETMMHPGFLDMRTLHPVYKNYVNAWDYVRELQVIQAYYAGKRRPIPPSLSGNTDLYHHFYKPVEKSDTITLSQRSRQATLENRPRNPDGPLLNQVTPTSFQDRLLQVLGLKNFGTRPKPFPTISDIKDPALISSLVQKAEFTSYNSELGKKLLANIEFRKSVFAGGSNFYISEPITFTTARGTPYKGSVIMVEKEGRVSAQLYYLSNSKAELQWLPAYVSGEDYFFKGDARSKNLISPPFVVSKAFQEIQTSNSSPTLSLNPKESMDLLEGFSRKVETTFEAMQLFSDPKNSGMAEIADNWLRRKNIDYTFDENRLPENLSQEQIEKEKSARDKHPAGLVLSDDLSPDYTSQVDSGYFYHPLLERNILFEVYHKTLPDGSVSEVVVHIDPKTGYVSTPHIGFAGVETNQNGLPRQVANVDPFLMPFYQYKPTSSQNMIRSDFVNWIYGHPTDDNYVNAWNYIRELKHIQDWYKAKNLPIPPRLGEEPVAYHSPMNRESNTADTISGQFAKPLELSPPTDPERQAILDALNAEKSVTFKEILPGNLGDTEWRIHQAFEDGTYEVSNLHSTQAKPKRIRKKLDIAASPSALTIKDSLLAKATKKRREMELVTALTTPTEGVDIESLFGAVDPFGKEATLTLQSNLVTGIERALRNTQTGDGTLDSTASTPYQIVGDSILISVPVAPSLKVGAVNVRIPLEKGESERSALEKARTNLIELGQVLGGAKPSSQINNRVLQEEALIESDARITLESIIDDVYGDRNRLNKNSLFEVPGTIEEKINRLNQLVKSYKSYRTDGAGPKGLIIAIDQKLVSLKKSSTYVFDRSPSKSFSLEEINLVRSDGSNSPVVEITIRDTQSQAISKHLITPDEAIHITLRSDFENDATSYASILANSTNDKSRHDPATLDALDISILEAARFREEILPKLGKPSTDGDSNIGSLVAVNDDGQIDIAYNHSAVSGEPAFAKPNTLLAFDGLALEESPVEFRKLGSPGKNILDLQFSVSQVDKTEKGPQKFKNNSKAISFSIDLQQTQNQYEAKGDNYAIQVSYLRTVEDFSGNRRPIYEVTVEAKGSNGKELKQNFILAPSVSDGISVLTTPYKLYKKEPYLTAEIDNTYIRKFAQYAQRVLGTKSENANYRHLDSEVKLIGNFISQLHQTYRTKGKIGLKSAVIYTDRAPCPSCTRVILAAQDYIRTQFGATDFSFDVFHSPSRQENPVMAALTNITKTNEIEPIQFINEHNELEMAGALAFNLVSDDTSLVTEHQRSSDSPFGRVTAILVQRKNGDRIWIPKSSFGNDRIKEIQNTRAVSDPVSQNRKQILQQYRQENNLTNPLIDMLPPGLPITHEFIPPKTTKSSTLAPATRPDAQPKAENQDRSKYLPLETSDSRINSEMKTLDNRYPGARYFSSIPGETKESGFEGSIARDFENGSPEYKSKMEQMGFRYVKDGEHFILRIPSLAEINSGLDAIHGPGVGMRAIELDTDRMSELQITKQIKDGFLPLGQFVANQGPNSIYFLHDRGLHLPFLIATTPTEQGQVREMAKALSAIYDNLNTRLPDGPLLASTFEQTAIKLFALNFDKNTAAIGYNERNNKKGPPDKSTLLGPISYQPTTDKMKLRQFLTRALQSAKEKNPELTNSINTLGRVLFSKEPAKADGIDSTKEENTSPPSSAGANGQVDPNIKSSLRSATVEADPLRKKYQDSDTNYGDGVYLEYDTRTPANEAFESLDSLDRYQKALELIGIDFISTQNGSAKTNRLESPSPARGPPQTTRVVRFPGQNEINENLDRQYGANSGLRVFEVDATHMSEFDMVEWIAKGILPLANYQSQENPGSGFFVHDRLVHLPFILYASPSEQFAIMRTAQEMVSTYRALSTIDPKSAEAFREHALKSFAKDFDKHSEAVAQARAKDKNADVSAILRPLSGGVSAYLLHPELDLHKKTIRLAIGQSEANRFNDISRISHPDERNFPELVNQMVTVRFRNNSRLEDTTVSPWQASNQLRTGILHSSKDGSAYWITYGNKKVYLDTKDPETRILMVDGRRNENDIRVLSTDNENDLGPSASSGLIQKTKQFFQRSLATLTQTIRSKLSPNFDSASDRVTENIGSRQPSQVTKIIETKSPDSYTTAPLNPDLYDLTNDSNIEYLEKFQGNLENYLSPLGLSGAELIKLKYEILESIGKLSKAKHENSLTPELIASIPITVRPHLRTALAEFHGLRGQIRNREVNQNYVAQKKPPREVLDPKRQQEDILETLNKASTSPDSLDPSGRPLFSPLDRNSEYHKTLDSWLTKQDPKGIRKSYKVEYLDSRYLPELLETHPFKERGQYITKPKLFTSKEIAQRLDNIENPEIFLTTFDLHPETRNTRFIMDPNPSSVGTHTLLGKISIVEPGQSDTKKRALRFALFHHIGDYVALTSDASKPLAEKINSLNAQTRQLAERKATLYALGLGPKVLGVHKDADGILYVVTDPVYAKSYRSAINYQEAPSDLSVILDRMTQFDIHFSHIKIGVTESGRIIAEDYVPSDSTSDQAVAQAYLSVYQQVARGGYVSTVAKTSVQRSFQNLKAPVQFEILKQLDVQFGALKNKSDLDSNPDWSSLQFLKSWLPAATARAIL